MASISRVALNGLIALFHERARCEGVGQQLVESMIVIKNKGELKSVRFYLSVTVAGYWVAANRC